MQSFSESITEVRPPGKCAESVKLIGSSDDHGGLKFNFGQGLSDFSRAQLSPYKSESSGHGTSPAGQ